MATRNTQKMLVSFNSGVITPRMDARVDLEKASASCRTLDNMFPRTYGMAMRRPGLRFIAEVKMPDVEE